MTGAGRRARGRAADPALLQTSADRVRALVERAAGRPLGDYDAEAHHELAREIAGRAIVLLKNEGGLLPLAADDGARSIAVIGEFARTRATRAAAAR